MVIKSEFCFNCLLEKRDPRLQDFIKVTATFTFIDMLLQLAKIITYVIAVGFDVPS